MKSQPTPLFRFQRLYVHGPVQVLNQNSYLMAEYNQHTGKMSWQRVVLADQKENVERWLQEHYPASVLTVH